MVDLFSSEANDLELHQPLAARMRPKNLADYYGQSHLLSPGCALQVAIEKKSLHSLVLWGPPGVGKTTLAKLIISSSEASSASISAVLSGINEIRDVLSKANIYKQKHGQAMFLFIDEVHRFNKTQQDVFLPSLERGDIILIAATTENPAFQLQNALLSRCRVYVLQPHTEAELGLILDKAIGDKINGLGEMQLQLSDSLRQKLINAADGDARQLLNMLEISSDFARLDNNGNYQLIETQLDTVLKQSCRNFDRGDIFYQQLSALHKSVRGSDPDAATYWVQRMLDAGCDPQVIARRLLRISYEDIGLADPRATRIALDAWQSYERLGAAEGSLALVQAAIYLSCAAKSSATYQAQKAASIDVKKYGQQPVPMSLCPVSSKLQQQLGYGKGYKYAHNEKDAFAASMRYFPDKMPQACYYKPAPRGLEIKISQKLSLLADKKKAVESKFSLEAKHSDKQ